MSQTIERAAEAPQTNEFDYRPMPILAPVSLVFGIFSWIGLLTLFGVALPIVGAILAAICLTQIRQADGALGGRLLARLGFGLSVLFFVSSSCLHAYAFATEVPEGYRRVNFPREISMKKFVVENGKNQLHPDVKPLVDQPIYIKGYMYPSQEQFELTSFVLLRDNGKCCFGGDPAPQDMIFVEMQQDQVVDFLSGLVAISGVLRANPNPNFGDPVYRIEGNHFGRAKTSF